ncbi:MAG: sigma-54-dependent transcriptional regulator [Nitrospirota bacterium]
MNKVLIVDDDKVIRLSLSEILRNNGFLPVDASSGKQALRFFEKENPSAVILDLKMPDMDGIEVLQELKRINPDVSIIIITAYGDVDTAVEAIKLGAYDFIVKPPKFDRLILTLKRAIEKSRLEMTVKWLNTAVEASLEWLLGKSYPIKKIIEQIHQVAQSDFSVIIQGETGTGKTTIASAIHNLSARATGPFITVDMGTIPETLVESELFGYEKGAFTGAEKSRKGFFEIANRGTILIDEVQNMSLHVQGKLLRAVEEKRIYPLGSTKPLEIDVRIIAATNSDIKQAVKEKKFREDLFFRLSEFVITLPPLRERVDDIPFFAQRFFIEACTELNKRMLGINDSAVGLLKQYPWPGNVRELKNVIRRAVLLSSNSVIKAEHLNFLIEDKQGEKSDLSLLSLKELSAIAVRDVEKKAIKQALLITGGNKTKAASILQIDYKTLLTKIKEYNIQ